MNLNFKEVRLLFFLLIVLSINGFAQSDETTEVEIREESSFYHKKKTHMFNAGIGMINPESFAFSLLGGSGGGKPTPSINLNYEYAFSNQIGLGLLVNYYRVDAEQDINLTDLLNDPQCVVQCELGIGIGGDCMCDGTVKERINVFSIAGKFSYHFYRIDKLDTYANTVLGYSFNRRKTLTESAVEQLLNETDLNASVPTFIYFASVGARYYASPNFGIYGEFGYGNTHLLQIGVTYRISKAKK